MEIQLTKLKELRERKEDLESQYKELTSKFEQDNELLISTLKQVKEAVMEEEAEIRNQAITKYNETGEKKFGEVKIRIMNELEYSPEVAFKWAMEHKLALQLDKKCFEGIAKTQDLDFVTKSEKPTATLPTKITK